MTATINRVQRPDSWRRAFIAQNGARCHYCNRAGSLDEGPGQRPWHVDHMNPLARGGADSEENLALSCKRCNLTKHAQEYESFKRFARQAWWQDRDGIDEGELDSLMHVWEHATGGDDRLEKRRDPETGALAIAGVSDDRDEDDWSPAVVAGWTLRVSSTENGLDARQRANVARQLEKDAVAPLADFVIAAYRVIPDLVAEIRQLRADIRDMEVAA